MDLEHSLDALLEENHHSDLERFLRWLSFFQGRLKFRRVLGIGGHELDEIELVMRKGKKSWNKSFLVSADQSLERNVMEAWRQLDFRHGS